MIGPISNCGGHGHTRRHFLFGTASAAQFLALIQNVEAQTSSGAVPHNSATACILFNLQGGISQIDSFDPKDGPWNPPGVDLRQYGGLTLSNLLYPNLSRITKDLLVLRSVSSWEIGHERAQFYAQTGRPLNPAFAVEIPHVGAIVASEKNRADAILPPFMSFNDPSVKGATFLGGRNEPFQPTAARTGLNLLSPAFYSSAQEFDQRNALLSALDAPLRANPAGDDMKTYTDFYGAARSMMFNPAVANVFSFSAADEQRYGNNALARSTIVARNAVQARNGTAFVNVAFGSWDAHLFMYDRAANASNYFDMAKQLDTVLYNLVQDLRASGDLSRTLIVLLSEFGRTPGLLNPRGGRDHFADVMNVVMVGGGVAGGRVIGTTSADGKQIVDAGWSGNRAMYVEDIMATIYSAIGIDWTKSITSNSNRKWQYVTGADVGAYQPITEVFG